MRARFHAVGPGFSYSSPTPAQPTERREYGLVAARFLNTGHLDPTYAADLRAKSRESADNLRVDRAFLRTSKSRGRDTLSDELGEDAVRTMTSAEDQSDRLQEGTVEEEIGGPFVITPAREEFARGTDRSNPRKSTREPFPKT